MEKPNKNSIAGSVRAGVRDSRASLLTPEHCLRLLLHRKWLILLVFAVVSITTAVITKRLPNVYSSETLILVDPQRVPENYVKPTVSGDIRNRLGTLKQQILSATRLQKIIDSSNLYPNERKTMAREDVITHMRSEIAVRLVGDYGGSQDLQAFRIAYSGADPVVVAQVTNELAGLFIEENMKARERQAEGTSDFLTSQLDETRKTLEELEGKLSDFKLKHIGEMPEQQSVDLQILGQLQGQLQLEGDALSRAQQQKSYAESMMAAQPAGVVDLDDLQPPQQASDPVHQQNTLAPPPAPGASSAMSKEQQLAYLLAKGYTEDHHDVKKLRAEIAQQAKSGKSPVVAQNNPAAGTSPVQAPLAPPPPAPKRQVAPPPRYVNPILATQVESAEAEIAKHKEQIQAISKRIASYQAKLEQIPVREQQIAQLVRDYEISKAHYGQMLNNQLSASTAAQLEVRQQGEKFTVLDTAQPAQTPSRPRRKLINACGAPRRPGARPAPGNGHRIYGNVDHLGRTFDGGYRFSGVGGDPTD